ncbi:MAG: hypothetical protein NTW13_04960 [Candidatus Omnitrophica bacterium]|nr:hypothetical protein [Candidatus Omnitrophota bacterium]
MKSLTLKKAQSLTEIALIIGVVGLVFVGMEAYVKRGYQAKIKALTDSFIGTEQRVYSVDTKDLEVLGSLTNSSFDSEQQESTLIGGAKISNTQQNQSINYTSVSQDTN